MLSMNSLFPADAVIRRVDAENALILGAGRALLMQLAHPDVARGVAEHSDFETDPLGRLRSTLDAAYTIVFGSDEEIAQTSAAVRAVHDRVQGAGYRANDPALLLWVNATLTDTALRVYTAMVGPLNERDRERYYEESTLIAEVLGCPRAAQPANLTEFRDYVRTMVGSLEVTDTARAVAASVLHPRLPWVTGPALALARFITVGMLAPPLRRQYRFAWDGHRQRLHALSGLALGRVYPLVPGPVRRAPILVR
jgi:uncharacterized protein (DUF2236 family)